MISSNDEAQQALARAGRILRRSERQVAAANEASVALDTMLSSEMRDFDAAVSASRSRPPRRASP